jgi:predicted metal-binding protein
MTIYIPTELVNKILTYRNSHPIHNLICCKYCKSVENDWWNYLQIFHNDTSECDYYVNTTNKTSDQKRKRDLNIKPAGFHIICSDCIYDNRKN